MQTQSTAVSVFWGTEEQPQSFQDNKMKDLCLDWLQYLIPKYKQRLDCVFLQPLVTHSGIFKNFRFPRSLQPPHLDDFDGLFDLLQFLRPLLDQVFELRSLLSKITLQGQIFFLKKNQSPGW